LFAVNALRDDPARYHVVLDALALNPISALTHATLDNICRCRETRALALEMMREAEGIAANLGVTLRLPLERRLAGAETVGANKTSMLQDVGAGRPLEADALLTAVLDPPGVPFVC
jgi:2-dehydropantoate 2-reductase